MIPGIGRTAPTCGWPSPRTWRATGAHERARALALQAVEEGRAIGRPDILLDAAMVIAGDRGWSEAGAVDEVLVDILEEGLEALPREDSSLRAMATARLGSELYFVVAETARRQQLTDEARAMAERLGDPDTSAFVLGCALWGSWLPYNAPERRAQVLELVDLAERSGNHTNRLTSAMWLANCEADLGNGDAYRHAVSLEKQLAGEVRQPEWLWASGVHACTLALMDADYDQAQALMDDALRAGQQIGSETALQMYGVQLFALARARDGLEDLVPTLQAMVEQFPLTPAWRCALAYLYRELDMRDEAREQFEHLAADDIRSIPLDANWKVGVSILAAVSEMLQDRDRAVTLHDMLLPLADTMIVAGMPADILGSVHGRLMLLTATLGRWDEAAAHYEAALEANRRMGCRSWCIYSTYDWARLLAGSGREVDAARAAVLLRDCLAEAREVGMTRVARLAEELLAHLA